MEYFFCRFCHHLLGGMRECHDWKSTKDYYSHLSLRCCCGSPSLGQFLALRTPSNACNSTCCIHCLNDIFWQRANTLTSSRSVLDRGRCFTCSPVKCGILARHCTPPESRTDHHHGPPASNNSKVYESGDPQHSQTLQQSPAEALRQHGSWLAGSCRLHGLAECSRLEPASAFSSTFRQVRDMSYALMLVNTCHHMLKNAPTVPSRASAPIGTV